jgi:hypothetical protein
MGLFTESDVRARAKAGTTFQKSASIILTERARAQVSVASHDIFLSHSFADKEIILGVALLIEDLGYSVFIDWRDDPYLDRSNVTPGTAQKLRARMKSSRCLFYATTSNSSDSKWMPWELGFKDGDNTRAAILPIMQYSTTTYQGREYLGIYPYVDVGDNRLGQRRLWVRRSSTCYVHFDGWLAGENPTEHSD